MNEGTQGLLKGVGSFQMMLKDIVDLPAIIGLNVKLPFPERWMRALGMSIVRQEKGPIPRPEAVFRRRALPQSGASIIADPFSFPSNQR